MAILAADFIYKSNFPTVSPAEIDAADVEVSAMWSGALTFWSSLPSDVRDAKRNLVENLLVAWHLADLMPSKVVGIASNGGMPLKAKSIGGVDIVFDVLDVQDALKPLTTNVFGIRALQMMLTAPERFGLRG